MTDTPRRRRTLILFTITMFATTLTLAFALTGLYSLAIYTGFVAIVLFPFLMLYTIYTLVRDGPKWEGL